MHKQAGQTLIETVIAIFILVMGIVGAFGLAVYSLASTQGVVRQIVAMGLAREGVEMVKNMRDTNWLKSPLSTDCYDFQNQTYTGLCFKDWLNAVSSKTPPDNITGYNIDPGTGSSAPYILQSNTSSGNGFVLSSASGTNAYKVYQVLSNGAFKSFTQGLNQNDYSGFSRKITLTRVSSGPFAQTNPGPALLVKVDVWWTQRNCAFSQDVPTSPTCKVTLETYLTNWKTY